MINVFKIFASAVILTTSMGAFAEPWLATRYAQNCSACHAPGRVNVPTPNRRCTVTCQSCHTNPNGGGLRNFYGKWNQERWLNSLYFKDYKLNKPRPMPTKDQWYADDKIQALAGDKEKEAKVAAVGFRLRETTSRLDEKEYDHNSMHERFVEPDPELALARIPDSDPYRETRNNYFNAGIDSRYFYLDDTIITNSVGKRLVSSIPMGNDLAASVSPVHHATAVVEARFLNGPQEGNGAWDYAFESQSQVRSAYALVDDLPYNSFVMYGLYRPLFGNYSPDHTSIFSAATGLDQMAVYRALTIGTAPGVPFFNLHFIQPTNQLSNLTTYKADKGIAANLGAHFQTMGSYVMASYWNTESNPPVSGAIDLKTNMMSVTGGFTAGRYTFVADITHVQKESVGVRKDAGNVITWENRYRFWRENYFKVILEDLNTARNLDTGSTTAYTIAINSFLVSSVEVELLYRTLNETDTAPGASAGTNGERATWAQIHLFF